MKLSVELQEYATELDAHAAKNMHKANASSDPLTKRVLTECADRLTAHSRYIRELAANAEVVEHQLDLQHMLA